MARIVLMIEISQKNEAESSTPLPPSFPKGGIVYEVTEAIIKPRYGSIRTDIFQTATFQLHFLPVHRSNYLVGPYIHQELL